MPVIELGDIEPGQFARIDDRLAVIRAIEWQATRTLLELETGTSLVTVAIKVRP